MRALHFAWPAVTLVVALALGCGESEPGSNDSSDAGQGSGATAASGSAGKSSGTSGDSASGNSASGGSVAGTPATGGRPNGDAGGRPDGDSGGPPDGAAGADTGAGGGGLVDCSPANISCRRAPPVGEFGEAPSVEGICYGPCVPIDTCACSAPGECPNPNEYTCWMQEHCGPYVQ
jgi:hypothetical protein